MRVLPIEQSNNMIDIVPQNGSDLSVKKEDISILIYPLINLSILSL